MSEMIKIPDGWESIELEKLLYRPIAYGVLKPEKHDPNGINLIRIQDVKDNKISDNLFKISGKLDAQYSRTKLNENDLILSLVGTLGKLIIINKEYKNSNISRAFGVIGIKHDLYSHIYIKHLLESDFYQNWIIENARGNAQKVLNVGILKQLNILIPKSKTEQQKIAEVLSEVDNAISKTEELFEKNKRLKTALMQDLLNYGIDENGKVRTPQTHKFKSSELGDIPIEWDSKVLKQICKVRQGLQIAIKQRFKESGENRYVYITVQYLNNKEANEEFIQSPDEDLICHPDDILFTRTGNTGQIITGVHGVFHNNFFRVDIDKDTLDKDFMVYFLNYEVTQQKIKDLAATTTIPDLKHSDFYSLGIKFPKLKTEQQKIAQILSSQDEKIEDIKNKLNKLKSLKASLMQDLLSGKVRVTKLMESN